MVSMVVDELLIIRLTSTDRPGPVISSEQGTAGRCKWCQKLFLNEMLTRTWLDS
jgi:hypothetical protein